MSARSILNHRRKYYSEFGEDGLLLYIIKRIEEVTSLDKFFVEFGAWDGKHGSNTFIFAEAGYSGIFIEADTEKFLKLKANVAGFPAVSAVCKLVQAEGNDSLENILQEYDAPKNLDILSIDIDGDDYWVWKGLTSFRPKVVVIELNFKDKPGVHRINQPGAPFVYGITGTSITSMNELAEEKGYKLIANIGCNAVFVDATYYSLFHAIPVTEFELFTYEGFKLKNLSLQEAPRFIMEKVRKKIAFALSLK
jgi:hypothetical protein